MTTYQDYIKEIEERKQAGLHPKPIDESELLSEIITQIKAATSKLTLAYSKAAMA